ncbi:MAG: type I DNA topoisomerase [Lachnospiraceae bacterium]|nr:type I DNA topoisomerase [Lachnospiraceae bacterium]
MAATAKKNLVIVESPTKVKAIKRFLGNGYDVAASNGHVRDLPKSRMGVDTEHDYEPQYITIRGKGDLLAGLRKQAAKADHIFLATDPDREGEAISWHLIAALKLDKTSKKCSRITFNEITKGAVRESLKHAREIDMHLVDAQQARRVLDRVVGYRISPLLWDKIKRGLSAGRVQSVALRIICDREEEIAAFIPKEYWTLDVSLRVAGEKKPLVARYWGDRNGKKEIATKEELDAIVKSLNGKDYYIEEIKTTERSKKPPLPFTTSTLQQQASSALNFSTQKTMRVAQQLYEGIDLKTGGTVGLITYLRTDSTRISAEAGTAATEYIREQYGETYLGSGTEQASKGGHIQDAHEAIRPTDITRTPTMVKDSLTREQFRLYQLIWKRFVASRMAAARYETTSVSIGAGDHIFHVAATRTVFDGFMNVYTDADNVPEKNILMKGISKETKLGFDSFEEKQHFTAPPAHYTEAALVHDLEALGIGRPSTYAPTITTILARHYITKENRNLYVTELGEAVNKLMKENFPDIVDVHFTATMEQQLDGVADGEVPWKKLIEDFYPSLNDAVEKAEKELEKVTIADEETDVVCEHCGRHMVIKYGPHGKFLACPGFPECRNTMPYYEKIGVACPKCGEDIVIRKTRKGRRYFGCVNNPECDFMVWQKPSKTRCPVCGGVMLEKGGKIVCMEETCGHTMDRPEEEQVV